MTHDEFEELPNTIKRKAFTRIIEIVHTGIKDEATTEEGSLVLGVIGLLEEEIKNWEEEDK